MKKTAFYFLLTAIALMFVACEKGDDSDPVVTDTIETYSDYKYWCFKHTNFSYDTTKWDTLNNYIADSVPVILTSNVILNYTFDNTVKNTVANGVNSTFINTASKYAIKVDKTDKLCFEKNFTLSAWVKLGITSGEQTIIRKHASTGAGYSFNYNATGISFYVNRGNVSDRYKSDETVTYSNDTLNTDWHFVTAVFDGKSLKLYVDGAFKNEVETEIWKETKKTEFLIPTPTVDYNLYIGNSAAGDTPFNGSIDQVMVFNKALTSDEVSSLYDAQK